MSQWSRHAAGQGPKRNVSLPIFFESIQEEDQQREAKEALKVLREQGGPYTKTVDLRCLSLKTIPAREILRAWRGLDSPRSVNEIDYEQMFTPEESQIVLDLQGNLLEEVPNEIFEIRSIKGLLLRSNRIERISPRIRQLAKLSALTLANNPIKCLPVEIKQLGLTQFTVSLKDFMDEEEIEERNAQISFKNKTLSELCLEKAGPLSFEFLGKSGGNSYEMCSVCDGFSQNMQEYYVILPYREYKIPFVVSVCSRECQILGASRFR